MKTETKLNFLAIVLTCVVVAIGSIVFTPVGGLLLLVMIVAIYPHLREDKSIFDDLKGEK